MAGGVESTTSTVKLSRVELPEKSVAEHVTSVEPMGKRYARSTGLPPAEHETFGVGSTASNADGKNGVGSGPNGDGSGPNGDGSGPNGVGSGP